jgi:hypothetical protein
LEENTKTRWQSSNQTHTTNPNKLEDIGRKYHSKKAILKPDLITQQVEINKKIFEETGKLRK